MANENGAKKGNFFTRVVAWFKNLGLKIGKAFYNMFHEMKKVTWPTKKETSKYMAVVIGVCAAFALLFWIIDTGILALLGLIV